MSTDYDIIIVGSGPSGTSTALHLAQIAPELISRTLILEKEHHPRRKLCGGGVLMDAEIVLRGLGLDITELPVVDADWAHFDFEGKGMRMRSDDRNTYAFRVVRRHEFDSWLAGKARERGIEIKENITVKNVKPNQDDVTVETDAGIFRAQVVVGADGSKGVVRRSIVQKEATHTARLLEIVTMPSQQTPNVQSDAYFDFQVVPQGIQGYTWDFPAVENGRPIRVRGIYDSNVNPSAPRNSLRNALADEFKRHGHDLNDYKLEGHPIRWFESSNPFCAPRILLVGDAAGVDALYGEGISPALGYGALAAQSIREAFAKKDFSFKDYRARVLRSELGKALALRTLMARVLFNLKSAAIQSFLWNKCGTVLKWVVQTFLVNWAKREQQKATR